MGSCSPPAGGRGRTRPGPQRSRAAASPSAHAPGRNRPRTLYVLGIDVDGDLIGIIRLRATDGTGHLAYILREDTWSNGHATAAVRLLPVGDTVMRITAEHRTSNPASGRVLMKAGFWRRGRAGAPDRIAT
ncbi:GNAT family N-acetyltransferase [Streptomyces sp. NPDC088251]|uniref:GNAT family N-acetyltransferase n=1 Tax=Streptomyces sp. NPDC088251 TaxID=3365844 RepID=UPI00382EC52A